MPTQLLSIGDFSARSRLSPKALRLYAELGLLVPKRVDPATGYRWYGADQLGRARIVALLRHLDMPLARIAEVLDRPPPAAIAAVRDFWAASERTTASRAATADYLCRLLEKGIDPMDQTYAVAMRTVAERALLSAVRYVHEDQAGATMGALLGQMRAAGPGLPGVDGCPFAIYHGAVSADSDGPMEIVRPVADLAVAQAAATRLGDVQARPEAAHEEAYVRLTMAQAGWPAQLAVIDAIEAHLRTLGRAPTGPPRQVMIADWRTVAADAPACDLAVPVGPAGR